MKVGRDVAGDVKRIKAVRERVGDEIAIRVDVNQGWKNSATALQAVRQLENEVIYEGTLGEKIFKVVVLTKGSIAPILSLQQIVCDALHEKNILQPLSEGEFLSSLNGNGLMIGAFVEEELIAFRALLVPGQGDEHLGYDLGLVDEVELARFLYQEISNVHSNYRGFGLQKTLAKVIMEQVDTLSFDYVCATVMPYNIASLKDKFSQGMYAEALEYKDGGKIRYVFAKRLGVEAVFENESIIKLMGDIEGQQELLKNGYVGVTMKQVEDDWVVEYKKLRK